MQIKDFIPIISVASFWLGYYLGVKSGRLREKRDNAMRMVKAASEAMKEMEKFLKNMGGRPMGMGIEPLFPTDQKTAVKDEFDQSAIKKALAGEDDES